MCLVPRGLLLNELAVVYGSNVSLPMFGPRLERRGKAADVTATGDAIGPERDVLIRGHRALAGAAIFPTGTVALPRPCSRRKRHTRGRRTAPLRFDSDRDGTARTGSLGI